MKEETIKILKQKDWFINKYGRPYQIDIFDSIAGQILNIFKDREARRMQEIIDFIETGDKTATDIKSFINGTYLEEQNK